MWSLHAALDLRGIAFLRSRQSPARNPGDADGRRGASILGVGHFTVPPDVIVEGLDSSNGKVTESWSTMRATIVPQDIPAVPRRSPIKARKRTPWNPKPEPHGVVERGGSREWMSDRLFVESRQAHLPAACSTSAIVHAVVVILVLLLLAARAARADLTPPRTVTNVTLRMPAMVSVLPVTLAPPLTPKSIERPSPAAPPPAPLPARPVEAPAAAPLETPSSVEPEPATLAESPIESAVAGAEAGGAAGGVVGGVAGGTGVTPLAEPVPPPAATGPFRVGEGVDRPRKIKDVKPVYPLEAMAARVGGNVLIEATIGVDGKVHAARILQSVGLLDQAALDAVRRWEFEPGRLNGVAVAVTFVIVVTFSLL